MSTDMIIEIQITNC